jgi:outer membrane protein
MMKSALAFIIAAAWMVGVLPFAHAQDNPPLTLEECYALALKQSETIAINREQINEARAHFLQALGTILPHVSFVREQNYQDTAGSSAYEKRNYDQKFVFTQTLFAGFREFAGMSGSRSEIKQRTNETKRAEQLLFVDVADAFYLLLQIREDLKTLEKTKQVFVDRIDEIKLRVDIGRSRQSEISSTMVQLYSVEADIQSVRSQEIVARDLLSFLIGQPVTQIGDPGAEIVLLSESEYLKGVSVRPDVQAAKFQWESDKKKAYIAKTGFMPTVDVTGNLYTHKSTEPEEGDWDAMLSVNVPIFKGTETIGSVKAASAVAAQSKLKYRRALRLALQGVNDSYSRASLALERVEMLKKAVQAADENFTLQEQDYKKSLVNNLDVLSAVLSLQDASRNFNGVYYESRRLYWQLRASAGDIPGAEKE